MAHVGSSLGEVLELRLRDDLLKRSAPNEISFWIVVVPTPSTFAVRLIECASSSVVASV